MKNEKPFSIKRHQPCGVGIHFDLRKIDIKKIEQIESIFHEMGINFDSGSGCGERDWCWDFSLRGPVRVTFYSDNKEKKRDEQCSSRS